MDKSYSIFCIASQLLTDNERELDVVWQNATELYNEFLNSSFDNVNESELDCINNFLTYKNNTMEKDVYTYDFNDWVNEMLNQSDYTELELLDFKEHYQNLLDDDQNAENFLNYKNLI